jgi:uncharacterized protein YecT (DUF1311 family)
MRSVLLVLSLAAILPLSALFAEDCANATSQMALNACADQEFKKSDGELNTLYRQIQARLKADAATTKLLVTAQRAWVAYRDAECQFAISGSAQGSIYPMLVSECRNEMTKRRVADFKNYLNCKEGDMSCPVPAK